VIVGRDPVTDSALIRLPHAPAMLTTATLGDSDLVRPGDWVMAIGNPFQLGHSVTVGVVSHARRPFHVREGLWQNLIQTNASINPGNSGGPLINVHGEVVGITAAVLAGAANLTAGIGFAIPINTIKAVLPQLRSGKVVRGRLGSNIASCRLRRTKRGRSACRRPPASLSAASNAIRRHREPHCARVTSSSPSTNRPSMTRTLWGLAWRRRRLVPGVCCASFATGIRGLTPS
jgi:hypothetical protein